MTGKDRTDLGVLGARCLVLSAVLGAWCLGQCAGCLVLNAGFVPAAAWLPGWMQPRAPSLLSLDIPLGETLEPETASSECYTLRFNY